ncbi:GLRK-like protein [Mya arenaria]|uniref:GLRK-like protein n=1 Tax=Mya arenaria TaxID=6604 RepID=A0ABY7DJC0_MYAAR|nr:glutamate receptor U1-like isoform X2 [Mya arenaria]WAQ97786.1 GLRK-like protein [Mya arenaria]
MNGFAFIIWFCVSVILTRAAVKADPGGESGIVHKQTFSFTALMKRPWIYEEQSVYRGFLVDLMEKISSILRIDFKIITLIDDQYNRTLSELPGGVLTDNILNTADFGFTDETKRDVGPNASFSRPILSSGARILIQKPKLKTYNPLLFMFSPFSTSLWILLVATVPTVLVGMFCFDKAVAKTTNQEAIKHWKYVVYGRRGDVTRALRISLFVFGILMAFVYVACIAGKFMELKREQEDSVPFKTFHEMVTQSEIHYGAWFGIQLNFADDDQRKIFTYLNTRYSYYMNINEAVEKVKAKNGRYAAIVDSLEAEYLILNGECDVLLLRDILFPLGYAFTCSSSQQGVDLCENLSMAILLLHETGDIALLQRKWWPYESKCEELSEEDFVTKKISNPNVEPLNIADAFVAYVILCFGLVISLCVRIKQLVKADKQSTAKGKNDVTVKCSENEECLEV